ncbi:tRNA threonylcarbamoyladenosine biosynthesis protein YwlC [Corynebacterium kutscheri]|uniref:L-threonylcarbamoyladenylate synthase n=1 Tax=Corynebacterium kutscheri TaxID=35755 RepID=A0A0F6TDX2_9CORY|nr:L-threonylcarbamoyladenylate synthase [Corynebacterium kutscheri]AKE41646.1 tRNA threonylcarbamoyl adenosine modification protein, Sua5/YciO/YrdC/YwlC family [Corynebacterium kutscheri]VEH08922.1 tRNA threonylcarbamoyladenosine biosynthesis protein YwlC [Corynebacterium kutscheri]VEH09973.1 tRNA threonylcarbamoyladenosine biosynthesis protein YwlC [Corynebacterium kutscheri]VEH80052.1 tRNA threonylcarbamoyladenosine biosynthesis protein YwlC [Corynebacterium kutscheri]
MSRIYNCSDPAMRTTGLKAAVSAVQAGRLVVMPTDTLYGLGCDAFNNDAVAKLLDTKRRGPDMPVPVLVGSWDTARGLVANYTEQMRTLIEAFWPGALSMVVPQAPSLPWNLGDTRGTVMLRMPLHPVAIELLRETGPMAVSSANISGNPPAATVAEAKEQLGTHISVYLDGGQCQLGQASTIIDLSSSQPKILREGAISAERVAQVLDLDVETLR